MHFTFKQPKLIINYTRNISILRNNMYKLKKIGFECKKSVNFIKLPS